MGVGTTSLIIKNTDIRTRFRAGPFPGLPVLGLVELTAERWLMGNLGGSVNGIE